MSIHESDLNNENYAATYCPEDNKIRLYCGRVERPTYDFLRKNRWKATPKQDCDFVATWSVGAENTAFAMIAADDQIGDEDYSPQERADDRAERFSGYRDKRRAEAHGHADSFEAGPQAHGYQSQAKADRAARKHDRQRVKGLTQWDKAEYWQQRTAGVISNARYRSRPDVRRGRILTIEKDLRKVTKEIVEAMQRRAMWQKVLEADGLDQMIVTGENRWSLNKEQTSEAGRLAYRLAANTTSWAEYEIEGRDGKETLYRLLTDEAEPITPRQAAQAFLDRWADPADENTRSQRYKRHLEMRLIYENAMLEDVGGMAGAVEMEPGGWIRAEVRRHRSLHVDSVDGWVQIQAVNKSPATKRVTSVKIWATDTHYPAHSQWGQRKLHSVKVERMGDNAYRAPTDEEREAFKAEQKAAKAEKKASAPAKPKLLNPTKEDAERLQKLWNEDARQQIEEYKKGNPYCASEHIEQEVLELTQKAYSEMSKGSYSHFETVEVQDHGRRPASRYGEKIDPRPTAFKVRKTYGKGGFTHKANRVVFITDKPGKTLPLNWDQIEGKTRKEAAADLTAAEQPAPTPEAAPAPAGQLF